MGIPCHYYLECSVAGASFHLLLEVFFALGEIVVDDHDVGCGRIGPCGRDSLSVHVDCVIAFLVDECMSIFRGSNHMLQIRCINNPLLIILSYLSCFILTDCFDVVIDSAFIVRCKNTAWWPRVVTGVTKDHPIKCQATYIFLFEDFQNVSNLFPFENICWDNKLVDIDKPLN